MTDEHPGGRAERACSRVTVGAMLVVQIAAVAQFLVVSLGRMTYPFELEWFEGLTVDNAWRIAHGLPIYGPPDASFASSHYPPLYYVVALPFLAATGWRLLGARVLSWLAVVGCALVAAGLVRRAGGSWIGVLVAAGGAAAFYAATGYWYDLARCDALTTFFALAGVAALSGAPSRRRVWAAGALLVGATLVKQTSGLFAVAALAGYGLARDRPRLRSLSAALVVFGIASAAVLWLWSDGWIVQVYTLPAHHWRSAAGLWTLGSFVAGMLPMLAMAIAGASRPAVRLLLAETGAALVVAALSMSKVGGELNSAMPLVFLCATAAGVAAEDVWRSLGTTPRRRMVRIGGALALGAAPVWFGALPRNAHRWLPSAEERRQAQDLWDDMRAVEGEFLAYNYSFVSTILRERTYASGDRLFDHAGGFDAATFRTPDLARYPGPFLDAIRERRYAAIYTNGYMFAGDPVESLIRQHYAPARAFGPAEHTSETPRWRMATPRVKWLPRAR